MNKLYEEEYKKGNYFSFGKNWEDFLKKVDVDKINQARGIFAF